MGLRLRSRSLADTAASITKGLASERCFYIIVAALAIQALWFAFTARYPMAFDEDFHFGLIQLHAQQWLPFFTSQPPQADQYGAIVRDPSYLYHFLMSLPYRLLTLITKDQVAQIISLRLINIAMAVISLILTRKLLLRLGASRALTHTSLLLFILVPIVPFLAAHINYDNLFILFTVWALLETFNWLDDIKHRRLSVPRTALLVILFSLASIIKYAFLPIGAALVAAIVWQVIKHRNDIAQLRTTALASITHVRRWQWAIIIPLLCVSLGLFSERYAMNLALYHNLTPDCAKVLPVSSCVHYGPWARDYFYVKNKVPKGAITNLAYVWEWPFGVWLRSFFAINDTYYSAWPLPLPGYGTIVIAIAGTYLFIRYRRRLIAGNIYRQVLLLAFGLYTAALVSQTFQAYLKTGEPVAINGRYLLPFLAAIIMLAGLGFSELWKKRAIIKPLAVVVVAILFLQGGGVLTFILRSDDTWDWPNDAVVRINHTVRETLKPFVVGANQ